MKTLLASLLVLLAALTADCQSNIIYVPTGNYMQAPQVGVTVTWTLISPNPRVGASGQPILVNPVGILTDTNGVAWFTNMLWGYYSVSISGPVGTTYPYVVVQPTTTGTVSIAQLIWAHSPNVGDLPPNPLTNYLTEAQTVALFSNSAAINGSKITSLQASNIAPYSGPLPIGNLTIGPTNVAGHAFVDVATVGATNRYITDNGGNFTNLQATQLAGTVPLAQLPAMVATNGQGATLSAAFIQWWDAGLGQWGSVYANNGIIFLPGAIAGSGLYLNNIPLTALQDTTDAAGSILQLNSSHQIIAGGIPGVLTNSISGNAATATYATNAGTAANFSGNVTLAQLPTTVVTNTYLNPQQFNSAGSIADLANGQQWMAMPRPFIGVGADTYNGVTNALSMEQAITNSTMLPVYAQFQAAGIPLVAGFDVGALVYRGGNVWDGNTNIFNSVGGFTAFVNFCHTNGWLTQFGVYRYGDGFNPSNTLAFWTINSGGSGVAVTNIALISNVDNFYFNTNGLCFVPVINTGPELASFEWWAFTNGVDIMEYNDYAGESAHGFETFSKAASYYSQYPQNPAQPTTQQRSWRELYPYNKHALAIREFSSQTGVLTNATIPIPFQNGRYYMNGFDVDFGLPAAVYGTNGEYQAKNIRFLNDMFPGVQYANQGLYWGGGLAAGYGGYDNIADAAYCAILSEPCAVNISPANNNLTALWTLTNNVFMQVFTDPIGHMPIVLDWGMNTGACYIKPLANGNVGFAIFDEYAYTNIAYTISETNLGIPLGTPVTIYNMANTVVGTMGGSVTTWTTNVSNVYNTYSDLYLAVPQSPVITTNTWPQPQTMQGGLSAGSSNLQGLPMAITNGPGYLNLSLNSGTQIPLFFMEPNQFTWIIGDNLTTSGTTANYYWRTGFGSEIALETNIMYFSFATAGTSGSQVSSWVTPNQSVTAYGFNANALIIHSNSYASSVLITNNMVNGDTAFFSSNGVPCAILMTNNTFLFYYMAQPGGGILP